MTDTTRVACPHCGFQNFSISAYCGRCERPLPRVKSEPSETRPLGRAPTPAPVPTPPAAPRPVARPLTPPPRMPPGPTPAPLASTPPPRAPAPARPPPALVDDGPTAVTARPQAPAAALGHVPAPLPPLSLEAMPLPAQPIELSAAQRRKRQPGPNLGDLSDDPAAEVPVTVPSTPRLFLARCIDGGLVLALVMLVVVGESLITGARFGRTGGLLDRLAAWIDVNSNVVLHGAAVAILFSGAYSIRAALQSGQTLGR